MVFRKWCESHFSNIHVKHLISKMLQKYTNQDLTIPLYTCIKCRTILFDDTKLYTHEPGKHRIDSKRLLKV